MPLVAGDDLVVAEAVEAHQPVGLVEAVLAHQRRRLQRQRARCVGDRAERRVVDAPQPVRAVERRAGRRGSRGRRVASAPTIICVLWPAGAKRGGRARFGGIGCDDDRCRPRCVLGVVDVDAQARHRAPDRRAVLLRRQRRQRLHRRQLDVDAEPVGIAAGPREQVGARFGDRLQVDVAAEVVLLAQHPRHLDHLLHRVVGRADDPGAEEQALDAVAPVEVERQPHDLVDREAGARHVARDPVDAVQAVVEAEVGEAGSSAARCSGRRARSCGRCRSPRSSRCRLPPSESRSRAARGAGRVVLGGVGEDGELAGRDPSEEGLARRQSCMNIQLGRFRPPTTRRGDRLRSARRSGRPSRSPARSRRRWSGGGAVHVLAAQRRLLTGVVGSPPRPRAPPAAARRPRV